MYSEKDIADYYDQTEVHFRYFWNLKEASALHYGIWEKQTRSFTESLINTNKKVMALAGIDADSRVLDAGCGIGGTSIFIANEIGCEVHGITLSARQVESAKRISIQQGVGDKTAFHQQSYLNTSFDDNTFDAVVAIESMSSSPDTLAFLTEAHRILKPGGRLVVLDFFKSKEVSIDQTPDLKTFLNCWAIEDVEHFEQFEKMLTYNQFEFSTRENLNEKIWKSARRMYWGGVAGATGTWTYNLFRKASPWSRIHYKSGIAQWKSLKKGEWIYGAFAGVKPGLLDN